MARLIDADALLESEIRRCGWIPTIGTGYINEKNFESILAESPTVDAVEVKHGLWIDTPDEMTKYKCDNPKCGFPSFVPWNYCPNCGAKKDGVSDG